MSTSNREAALSLRLEPQVIRVEAPSPEHEKAFASMQRERAQALIVLEEPINQACRKQIADLAAAHRLPTVFPISMLDAGGLIAYGTSGATDGSVRGQDLPRCQSRRLTHQGGLGPRARI